MYRSAASPHAPTASRRTARRGPLSKLVSLVLRTPALLVLPFFALLFVAPALLLTIGRDAPPPAPATPQIAGCAMFCTDAEYTADTARAHHTDAEHTPARAAVFPDPSAPAATGVLFAAAGYSADSSDSGHWQLNL
ncbi:hypothetical protein [Nocardia asiatica]|uniref:hypothetical protein n=1 Tax=Nocardia asiatica TaxID=209252 RepID=UPI00030C975D|nr:hypothetical protein [Nocardia asiatica]